MKIWGNRAERFRREPLRALWIACFASVAIGAAVSFCSIGGIAQQGTVGSPALHDANSWPPISPLINRQPDANRLLEDSMKLQDNSKRMAELNAEREKEMAADTARLLLLAGELNSATEAPDKKRLSIKALRTVEEIEKLAHGVREKMRATIGN